MDGAATPASATKTEATKQAPEKMPGVKRKVGFSRLDEPPQGGKGGCGWPF
jgi:hypothetical protein